MRPRYPAVSLNGGRLALTTPLYFRTFDLRNAAVAFIGLGGLARRD